MYSTTCQLQAPVVVIVVEFDKYAPYFDDTKEVEPPERLRVPEYVGKDPVPFQLPPGAPHEPPFGVYVPLVLPLPATVPADPIENEVTKVLLVFTEDIVTLPADAADPLCIDFIRDEACG